MFYTFTPFKIHMEPKKKYLIEKRKIIFYTPWN